jgi:hypothetical protein
MFETRLNLAMQTIVCRRENDRPAAALAALPPDGSLLAAHPETAAEWWYYTGHLRTAAGSEYGFELTFFRARRIYRGMARGLSLFILRLYGIRIRVHRVEPLPAVQTVFVSNHTSSLDLFVLVALGATAAFLFGFELESWESWFPRHHQLDARHVLHRSTGSSAGAREDLSAGRAGPEPDRGIGVYQPRRRPRDDARSAASTKGRSTSP